MQRRGRRGELEQVATVHDRTGMSEASATSATAWSRAVPGRCGCLSYPACGCVCGLAIVRVLAQTSNGTSRPRIRWPEQPGQRVWRCASSLTASWPAAVDGRICIWSTAAGTEERAAEATGPRGLVWALYSSLTQAGQAVGCRIWIEHGGYTQEQAPLKPAHELGLCQLADGGLASGGDYAFASGARRLAGRAAAEEQVTMVRSACASSLTAGWPAAVGRPHLHLEHGGWYEEQAPLKLQATMVAYALRRSLTGRPAAV